MKIETLLRGGVAMSLLTCTILMFFLVESQRKLDESQTTLKLTQDTLSTVRNLSDSLYEENLSYSPEGLRKMFRKYFFSCNKRKI